MFEAYVRFQNNTNYNIEVIWIKGKVEEKYSVLPPKSFLDVNTYSIHSWIFRFVYKIYFVSCFLNICYL